MKEVKMGRAFGEIVQERGNYRPQFIDCLGGEKYYRVLTRQTNEYNECRENVREK